MLFIFAMLPLVVGCSRLSFIYGFAEGALKDEAAYFLKLDDTDERLVDRKINELMSWHNAEMLPRYAKFLNGLADLVAGDRMHRAAISDAIGNLHLLLDELVLGAAPHFADVLVNHTTPENIRYLEKRMTERLEERREELSKPVEERLQARVERITDNFELLAGNLDNAQVARIRHYVAQTVDANARWLDTRENRQRAFLNFLSHQPDRDRIANFLYKIILRGYEVVDPAYQSLSELRWQLFEILVIDIMTSLSTKQRRSMTGSLREYAMEILTLSK